MKKIIIISSLAITLLCGCSKNDTITEQFKIDKIENKNVWAGLTKNTGEGVYYSLNEFKKAGLKDIKIGEIINITWERNDYNNERWENFKATEEKK